MVQAAVFGWRESLSPSQSAMQWLQLTAWVSSLECAVGLNGARMSRAFPLRDTWKGLRTQLMNYLEITTLADMAAALTKKKELLHHPTQSRGK